MIRLSWRQFRVQCIVAGGVLIVVAVLLAVTGAHLAHVYDIASKAQIACNANPACQGVAVDIGHLDKYLELIGTALVVVPALVGAFWGAPLIAREFENGTQRLVWTQSVTRTRWLAVKLGVVGTASVVATGLLSLMVTWWSSPIDASRSSRFGAGLFGERNIVPAGYAAFGFALGVVAGLLIRRTVPAMAATLVGFLAVRLVFSQDVRPWLFSPRHINQAINPASMGFGSTNGGPPTLFPQAPNLPNAWIYSIHLVNGAGHALTPQLLATTCPKLSLVGPPPIVAGQQSAPAPAPASIQAALQSCVTKIGASYHEVVTFQPAGRYWPLQWIETTTYVAAAFALIGCCFALLRRRG